MTYRPFPDRVLPLAQLAGASLGLFVFSMMVLRGLWSGNPVETILVRAIAGLIGATILGSIAGALAERIMRDGPAAEPPGPSTSTKPDAKETAGTSG